MNASPAGHVLVIGSLNADLIARAPRLPRPGETVIGATFHVVAGGKGANQAVAVARLGAPVAMVGCVGDDNFGRLVCAELERANVDVTGVRVDRDAATGTGHIVVDAAGQNAIVVASGANMRVTVADATDAPGWRDASFVVLQLEIPLPAIAAAVATARARKVPVILNAAPAQALPEALYESVAWMVVNEVEAEQLTQRPVRSVADAIAAGSALRRAGQRVVVTLGPAGAVCIGDGEPCHEPAPQVDVVDSTAAGDAFVGALAAALWRGLPSREALRLAVTAGSLACTRLGAIPSLPNEAEVREWHARAKVG